MSIQSGEESQSTQMFSQRTEGAETGVENARNNDFLEKIQNSCLECSRDLDKNEIKVIPPMYIQVRDRYVRNGVVLRRYMCVPCYNEIRKPVKVRHKTNTATPQHSGSRRARLIRGLLAGLMTR